MNTFYLGLMMLLVVGNAVQIGKGYRNGFLSWIQLFVFVGSIIWYFSMRVNSGALNSNFFFFTTLAFVGCLVMEFWEFSKNGKPSVLSLFFLILNITPVVFSVGIISGMF